MQRSCQTVGGVHTFYSVRSATDATLCKVQSCVAVPHGHTQPTQRDTVPHTWQTVLRQSRQNSPDQWAVFLLPCPCLVKVLRPVCCARWVECRACACTSVRPLVRLCAFVLSACVCELAFNLPYLQCSSFAVLLLLYCLSAFFLRLCGWSQNSRTHTTKLCRLCEP